LVLDPEADAALADLLLEGLGQLDEGERVGLEIVGERVTLADRRGVDLEDVGQSIADQVEDLLAIHGAALDVGLGGHSKLSSYGPAGARCSDAALCALVTTGRITPCRRPHAGGRRRRPPPCRRRPARR